MMAPQDEHFMGLALAQAHIAEQHDEVPVGAVLVRAGEVIAEAFNQPIGLHDPSAHAEVLVLRQAAQDNQNYRLPGCTLYVTLEPCLMCVGAMVHARIERVVFGALDPKTGAVATVMSAFDAPGLNHRVKWGGGVLAAPCAQILKDFFQKRR